MSGGVSEKSAIRSLYEASLYGISRPLLALKGLLVIPLLTKTLGLADYGIWVLLGTTGAFLIELVVLRFPSAMLRLLPGGDRERLGRVYGTLLALVAATSVIMASVMAVVGEPLGRWMVQRPGAGAYLYLLGGLVALEAWLLLLFTYFRVLGQNVRYIGTELGFHVADLAGMATAVAVGGGLIGALTASLAVRIGAVLLLITVVQREQGLRMPSAPVAAEYLAYCLPLVVPELISWVLNFGNRYFLAVYSSSEMVGMFGMAHKLASIVLMIVGALEFAFVTEAARLWNAGEVAQAQARWRAVSRLFIGLAVPAAGLLSLLSPYLLTLLSTPQAGQMALQIVPYVAAANVAYGLYGYAVSLYLFARRTVVLLKVMGVASGINLALNAVFIPRGGVQGAAMATLISYLALMGLTAWMAARDFHFPVEWGLIVKSLAAVGVMAIPFWLLTPHDLVRYGLAALLGAVGYGVAFWLLRAMRPDEAAMARELLMRAVRRVGVSAAG